MLLNVHSSLPISPLPRPEGVDIWPIGLSAHAECEGIALLTADERARAARFALERPRRDFVAVRTSLRRILRQYLGREPELTLTGQGKPVLADADMHFNVSHSGDVGLIAVASCHVGIDVEQMRPMTNMTGLVERFFSREERNQFAGLPAEQKQSAFFKGWTGKEALLKAVGTGLGDLESCAVDLDPTRPARVIRFDHAGRWELHTWTVAKGYLASVASG